jgi:hypothetical protein
VNPAAAPLMVHLSPLWRANCNRLPERVSVGDTIELHYGSNPKRYRFHIVRIEPRTDGRCVLKGSSVPLERSEKIELDNCLPAPDGNEAISARP